MQAGGHRFDPDRLHHPPAQTAPPSIGEIEQEHTVPGRSVGRAKFVVIVNRGICPIQSEKEVKRHPVIVFIALDLPSILGTCSQVILDIPVGRIRKLTAAVIGSILRI